MSKNLKFAFEIAGKINSSFNSSFKSAADLMGKTKSELKGLNDLQKSLNDSFKAGVISQQAYNNAMAQTSKQAKELNNTQKGLSALQSMKGQITNGGLFKKAAVVGGVLFAPAIKSAMDFESSMADVRKVVDELKDPAEFKAMSNEILSLSKRIPMAAEDIAQIVAFGGQSGIARSELMEFAEGAAKMGIAFDISAEQAGETMAKWRAAFKMNQEQVVGLADAVNYLSDTNNAKAASISEVLNKIGSLGDIAGVGSKELAALGTVIMETGKESDVAGTGIKNFLLTMASGESATKRQAEAFSELGFDAQEVAKRMQVDAKGAMLDVLKAVRQLDPAKQTALMKDLFSKESVGAIADLVNNAEKLESLFIKLGDATNYAGSMEKEFASRSATTSNAMQIAKNSIAAVAIELGSVLLPTVAGTFKSIAEVASAVSAWSQKNPKLSSTIVKVATGVTLFSAGIGGLGWAISSIAGPIKMVGSAIRFVMGIMMANPILLAITALIVAGYLLYDNWETVKQFFKDFWESPAASLVVFLSGPIGWLIAGSIAVIQNWDKVKAWFVLLWNNPKEALSQFVQLIYDKFGKLLEWLGEKWRGLTAMFGQPISVEAKASIFGETAKAVGVAQNAQGGIYSKGAFLTTFAEKSSEAAIPLDGSKRAVSLWQQAGNMLGMKTGGGNNGGNVNLSAPITITINGNADSNTVNQVQQAVNDALADLERRLAALQKQKARVSYG